MALTTAQIQQAYVTFFSRPADVAGLNYWSQYPGSIDNLYATFAQSAEYAAAFNGLSNNQKVSMVYQNLFGRAADVAGLSYWTLQLDTGAVTVPNLALALSNGAQGTDIAVISSRVTAATSFTGQLDTTPEILAYSGASANGIAKAWLANVIDAASLAAATTTAALNAVVQSVVSGGGLPGQTFTLTTSATDVINGTSGNDTIIGDFTTSTTGGTIQPSDNINGGAGTDTFKIYGFDVAGSTNALPVTISGVEILDFVAPGADTTTGVDIDTTAYSGVTTVRVEQADNYIGASLGDIYTGNGQGLQLGTANKMKAGLIWDASNTDTSETLTLSGFNDGGKGLAVIGTALTSLNVVSNTAANTVNLTTPNAVTKLVVTGDKALDLSNAALNAAVVTVDASGDTGGVTALFGASATATVTGGSGADAFDVSAVAGKVVAALGDGDDTLKLGTAAINALSTFDGGAGTDTVQIENGTNLTTTTGKQFSNFEVLATGTGKGVYDVTAISGITAVKIDGDVGATGATEIKNLTTQSVTITTSQTVTNAITLSLKDNSGSADSLTINVNGAADVNVANKLITTGIETVTVNSSTAATNTAGTHNTLADLDTTGAKTLKFTGDHALTVTAFSNAGTVTQIDASGLSKGLTMGAATGATVGGSYIGGAGADTFLGNAKGDTFYGAGGGDTLILGAVGARDTVTYKAASDSVVAVKNGALDVTGMDTVNTFTTGEDTLNLKALGLSAYDNGAIANKGVDAGTTLLDLANGKAVATGWFSDGVSNQVVATLSNGGDTYVFVDANHDGNFEAGSDLVIKLAGTASIAHGDVTI